MLLMVEALLLISAALLQDHRAAVEGHSFPLDMAEKSVDDRYDGCTVKMANLVKTKYLKKEMKKSTDFKTAWEKGEKSFKTPRDNLTKNHSIAIYVYTDSAIELHVKFNNADRKDKRRYKDKTYSWYSLHFLLTDAIQILKKTQNRCYDTYRGTKVEFNVRNKEVRFGSFTSSSLNRNSTRFFGSKSCFEIHTCEGANVTKYSKLRHEEEVLIPPYETFRVIEVQTKGKKKDLWCETVYKLKSSGERSDLNCALFKKTNKTATNTDNTILIML